MDDNETTNSSDGGNTSSGGEAEAEASIGTLYLMPTSKEDVSSLSLGDEVAEGTNATGTSTPTKSLDDVTPEMMKSLEDERLFRQETEKEATARIFNDALVPVAGALVNTALFSSNARVRLEAQKMILDRTLGRVQDSVVVEERDPFKELLASCVRQAVNDAPKGTEAKAEFEGEI